MTTSLYVNKPILNKLSKYMHVIRNDISTYYAVVLYELEASMGVRLQELIDENLLFTNLDSNLSLSMNSNSIGISADIPIDENDIDFDFKFYLSAVVNQLSCEFKVTGVFDLLYDGKNNFSQLNSEGLLFTDEVKSLIEEYTNIIKVKTDKLITGDKLINNGIFYLDTTSYDKLIPVLEDLCTISERMKNKITSVCVPPVKVDKVIPSEILNIITDSNSLFNTELIRYITEVKTKYSFVEETSNPKVATIRKLLSVLSNEVYYDRIEIKNEIANLVLEVVNEKIIKPLESLEGTLQEHEYSTYLLGDYSLKTLDLLKIFKGMRINYSFKDMGESYISTTIDDIKTIINTDTSSSILIGNKSREKLNSMGYKDIGDKIQIYEFKSANHFIEYVEFVNKENLLKPLFTNEELTTLYELYVKFNEYDNLYKFYDKLQSLKSVVINRLIKTYFKENQTELHDFLKYHRFSSTVSDDKKPVLIDKDSSKLEEIKEILSKIGDLNKS